MSAKLESMKRAKLEYLKELVTGPRDTQNTIDIDWSGITATSLVDGTVWTADQLKPDLQVPVNDLINASKTLVLGAENAASNLIATITMAQCAPPSSAPATWTSLLGDDAPPGFYTVLGISQLAQSVQATQTNADGTTTAIPVLLKGNIAYQYETLNASRQQVQTLLDAITAGDNVFIDLYPSNVSAVVQGSNGSRRANDVITRTFSLQHAQPRTVPTPAALNGLPLMQGYCLIDGPTMAYNGAQDITATVGNLLTTQASQAGAVRPRGININLNGGDIATIIGTIAAFGLARPAETGSVTSRLSGGFGISVGVSISI